MGTVLQELLDVAGQGLGGEDDGPRLDLGRDLLGDLAGGQPLPVQAVTVQLLVQAVRYEELPSSGMEDNDSSCKAMICS